MEVTYVFCDKCNLENNIHKTFELPLAWVKALSIELEEGQSAAIALRGTYSGTFKEAKKDGWEERDYGCVCPVCIAEEEAMNDDGATVMGVEALGEVLEKK